MARFQSITTTPDAPAETPTVLFEDIVEAAWHVVDTLPDLHPLRPSLIHAAGALEDAIDDRASLAAALPIVVGLIGRTA